MTKDHCFTRVFILIAAFLLFTTSGASAKAPGSVGSKEKGVVAVHVSDKTGRHVASATGIVIDERGVVATSCFIIPKWLQVIEHTLAIKTGDGTESPLEHLISQNCSNGIALIKVKGSAFPVVSLASGHKPRKGEAVALVTMTAQGTSVTSARIKSTARDESFQITVPAVSGRDGSPILTAKGEFIGISTFTPGKKQKQPAVVPAKNVAKEFSKYKNLIRDISLSPAPAVPVPPAPDSADVGEADLASLTKEQREGKYDTAESAFLTGCSYDRAHKYKDAIEAYLRAVEMKPDYADAYVNLGVAYYRLERYDEAVNAYTQALRIRPDAQAVYNKLGATYIILGEYSKALATFKQSAKLDPRNSEAHFNLGVAFVIAGDKNGAIEEYIILKGLDRKSAEKLLDFIH